jgi:predicted helicase
LSREEKLDIIKSFKTIDNSKIPWEVLEPNEHGDWINHRNNIFDKYIPMEPSKKLDLNSNSFFLINSNGVVTNRDPWVYNYSNFELSSNLKRMIQQYNIDVDSFRENKISNPEVSFEQIMTKDETKIKWVQNLIKNAENLIIHQFEESNCRVSLHRPFTKENLYFNKSFNWSRYLIPSYFPLKNSENLVIITSGIGNSKDFSSIITNFTPDIQVMPNGQCFPLYFYEENNKSQKSIFDTDEGNDYVKRDGISDYILNQSQKQYDATNITKEDIFYYVYGFLHSSEYRESFSNDLKKMLPRIPLVEDIRDFWSFSKSGRELAELHLNYEQVPRYDGVKVVGEDSGFFKVEKMRFPKKDQKDTIIYNSKILIQDIPLEAYEYMVNGKSAIEWVMERYQITTHKESQITNDPNDWSEEVGNPRYILDLLLSVINVSVQTVEIVKNLPKLKFD